MEAPENSSSRSRSLEPVESIAEVRRLVAEARARGSRVGFVPTMGALHEGHCRLIRRCRAESDFVVVSIFVNPTQFGPKEDLSRYPRTLEEDLVRCAEAGADLVFVPAAAEIYPHGPQGTFVEVPGLSQRLEGASRPGHFRGVASVVVMLFEIVRPDLAIFGEKDFQQQLVVRRLIADLHLSVKLIVEPTVREPDGLAMSSRNRYLNEAERAAATVLIRALRKARESVEAGERRGDRVRQILVEALLLEPLASLDYAEVVDAATLDPVTGEIAPGQRAVALLAVRIGATRLIDNMPLTG